VLASVMPIQRTTMDFEREAGLGSTDRCYCPGLYRLFARTQGKEST
jgi:hypothetical protein